MYAFFLIKRLHCKFYNGELPLIQLLLKLFCSIVLMGRIRPTLKIFLFPLTQPVLLVWVGWADFFFLFLTSQVGYPLNLIVYSKTCLKRPLKKKIKNIVVVFKADYCIMQVNSIAECSQGAF